MKNINTLIVLLTLALAVRAEDEIASIDPSGSMITVKQKDNLKSYRLKPFTDITINGQKGTVAQLRAGMHVTLGLADAMTASKVTARGNLAPGVSQVPAQTPASLTGNRPNPNGTRKIVIKAAVDAGDNVIIQDGKLKIHHIDWSKPKDISINGINWKPEWIDNNTEAFTAFNPPLAPFGGSNLTIKKIKGRGDATLVEPPTEANGQKLIVHLQDTGSGASDFEVRITW